jgi:hypothetical protein
VQHPFAHNALKEVMLLLLAPIHLQIVIFASQVHIAELAQVFAAFAVKEATVPKAQRLIACFALWGVMEMLLGLPHLQIVINASQVHIPTKQDRLTV